MTNGGIQKVAFTMYPVEDAKRARRFYEEVLGLKVGSHAGSGAWTEYDLPGGGCLALFQTNDIKPSSGAGGSVALDVDDLDTCGGERVEHRGRDARSVLAREGDQQRLRLVFHGGPKASPVAAARDARSAHRSGLSVLRPSVAT